MNLAIRDIRHNAGRFILTCIGLSLLLGVVLAMIGIYRGLVTEALSLVRNTGAQIWIVEQGSRGPFAEASRIPGDTREAVARLAGVKEAGSLTLQNIEIQRASSSLRLLVIGFEPGRLGGPPMLVAGRPVARAHFELVADKKTGLTLGDQIRLGRNDFEVVGLTENQVSTGGDPVVFISLADSQKLQFQLAPAAQRKETARGAAPGTTNTVNTVIARLDDNIDPEQVAGAVRRWKHLSALTQEGQETILSQSVIDKARRQIGLFTTTLLTVSTVIIALILYTMTMDKIREIATLKLIGAPDRTIVSLILQEALSMGVIAFGFGTLLISLLQDQFPRRVVIEWPDVAALGGVILLVCILASALGVRLALKVDPARALGG
jgi:putative ABC transport system permease protein